MKGRDPLSDLSNFCWHNEPVMVKIGVGIAIGNAEAFSPFSSLTRGRRRRSIAAASNLVIPSKMGPLVTITTTLFRCTKDQKVSLLYAKNGKKILDRLAPRFLNIPFEKIQNQFTNVPTTRLC